MPESIHAVTNPGLEEVLADEAPGLGLSVKGMDRGGVELEGEPGCYRRANLWLRTANRILLRVGWVPAAGGERWEQCAKGLRLERFAVEGAPLEVSVSGKPPRGFRAEAAVRAVVGAERGGAFYLRFSEEGCQVSVDTTGVVLHKRGYRQEVSRAPLRETLAAGMLLFAGYSGEEPLWDPMCGSGTIPIEGALISRRLAPGLQRRFAFQEWPGHDAGSWEREREEARVAQRAKMANPIRASDLHAGSLGTARRNARRAGVAQEISFERLEATRIASGAKDRPGLVATNLPFGERVGERSKLDDLYGAFGTVLRERFSGWRAVLLAQDERLLVRSMGGAPASSRVVDNGGLRCALMLWRL